MNLAKLSELRGLPANGSHDWDTIRQILDAGFLARVGFCVEGQPFVIPTFYGREGNKPYLHRSAASRMLRRLEIGVPACINGHSCGGLGLIALCFRTFHEPSLRCLTAQPVIHPIASRCWRKGMMDLS